MSPIKKYKKNVTSSNFLSFPSPLQPPVLLRDLQRRNSQKTQKAFFQTESFLGTVQSDLSSDFTAACYHFAQLLCFA